MRGFTAAILGLGLLAAPMTIAQAQVTVQPGGTVIVPAPAPSASPSTVVITPTPSGATVVAPPGSTITVQPPAPATAAIAVPAQPWCGGSYSTMGGSNFGSCPSALGN